MIGRGFLDSPFLPLIIWAGRVDIKHEFLNVAKNLLSNPDQCQKTNLVNFLINFKIVGAFSAFSIFKNVLKFYSFIFSKLCPVPGFLHCCQAQQSFRYLAHGNV